MFITSIHEFQTEAVNEGCIRVVQDGLKIYRQVNNIKTLESYGG